MNIADFKRIITSFADRQSDIAFDKGQLLTEIRGELIQVKIISQEGVLYVEENGFQYTAMNWIKNRIACLPQLAERIVEYIPSDKYFVNPCGKLLDELEYDPEEKEQPIDNTIGKLSEMLSRRIPGTSSIVYLTSDAGEGKTTIINQLAIKQAISFKQKQTNWLLVPIPLGGRPFLRFDDIVIASIVNNLRFRYLYYESFIELVRLGFVVPAFDGFEEMFMQSSTGEALSATGGLINKLNSNGSILIAARKAYFDYKSFGSQAKLLDTIESSVSFARFSLERWNRSQFVEFARLKGVSSANEIYDLFNKKLNNENHPILTRPVLVKQLIDVFKDIENINELVSKLESVSSYFPTFVNAIIEREANTKWIDTSGEPFKPLLQVDQHYELLALIAEEMWINNADSLKDTIIDLITEMFSEKNQLSIQISRDVKERVKQHALIVRQEPNNPIYRFDHEEFYEFFLGVALAEKIINGKIQELKNLLRRAILPLQAYESIVTKTKSTRKDLITIINNLNAVIKGETQLSYVRENVGGIVIRLLCHEKMPNVSLKGHEFPTNSLMSLCINGVHFEECHFQNTAILSSEIKDCVFSNCQFDRIEFDNSSIFKSLLFVDCEISSVYDIAKEKGFYDKKSITQYLTNKGISVEYTIIEENSNQLPEKIEDEDLEITEKALRRFIRSNAPINDSIFKLRLGNKADYFFKRILPDLLKYNIILELEYIGKGQKRRFKLGVTFGQIEKALNNCRGSYRLFLEYFVN